MSDVNEPVTQSQSTPESSVPAASEATAPTTPAESVQPAAEAAGSEADETSTSAETELPGDEQTGGTQKSSRRSFTAPALISLERIDDDDLFRLRPDGDVAQLAMDIARLGQLFPIDLRQTGPDRFQIITGFRRVAALNFLQREKVLARLHVDLTDDDAVLLALAEAVHSVQVAKEELRSMRDRLAELGRLSSAAKDMLEKALAEGEPLAPEGFGDEEEVDADELAADVTTRLGQINQDLSLLADVFKDLDPERATQLLEQLRYSSQLVTFLEDKS